MPSLSFRLNAVKLKTSFFSCVLLAWSGWLVVVSQTESTVCIVSSSPAVLSQTYILICSTVAISPLPYMFRCEQLRLAVLIVSASSLTYCNFLQFRRHLLLFSLDAWGFSPPPPLQGCPLRAPEFMHVIAQLFCGIWRTFTHQWVVCVYKSRKSPVACVRDSRLLCKFLRKPASGTVNLVSLISPEVAALAQVTTGMLLWNKLWKNSGDSLLDVFFSL